MRSSRKDYAEAARARASQRSQRAAHPQPSRGEEDSAEEGGRLQWEERKLHWRPAPLPNLWATGACLVSISPTKALAFANAPSPPISLAMTRMAAGRLSAFTSVLKAILTKRRSAPAMS